MASNLIENSKVNNPHELSQYFHTRTRQKFTCCTPGVSSSICTTWCSCPKPSRKPHWLHSHQFSTWKDFLKKVKILRGQPLNQQDNHRCRSVKEYATIEYYGQKEELTGSFWPGILSWDCAFESVRTRCSRWFLTLSLWDNAQDKKRKV